MLIKCKLFCLKNMHLEYKTIMSNKSKYFSPLAITFSRDTINKLTYI